MKIFNLIIENLKACMNFEFLRTPFNTKKKEKGNSIEYLKSHIINTSKLPTPKDMREGGLLYNNRTIRSISMFNHTLRLNQILCNYFSNVRKITGGLCPYFCVDNFYIIFRVKFNNFYLI